MLEILKSLLLSFFVIAVLLPVVRFVTRKVTSGVSNESITESEVKYMQRQEWKLMLLYFFFTSAIAVFSAGVLSLLASGLHNSQDHLYLLTPNFRAMFMPGLLIGLILAILPLWWTRNTVLGEDAELYQAYLQQQEGLRSKRTYTFILLFLLVIAGAITWYATRWHITINKQQMTITDYTLKQKTLQHSNISSIQFLGKEGEYIITFTDGTILNTSYLKPVQFETIALLAQQSGKRVMR
ncbi:hypothetical protein [Pontibacter arcticus]|uniref:Uncharacterized protein n=1 Tax=Pontibacter arcticus TaxID=2080288 RepID=A0A364RIZ7_9BACT|nr:hypothetical protein [Pontibacter arcticus]RAU84277.1 hypothetical protein DP923_04340 [Pontibacter arcticus]